MPTSFPTAGRLLDDDDFPASHPNAASRRWTRVSVNEPPPQEPMRSLPAPPARQEPPPLRTAQRACYEALGLALKEGHVFAALTGPEGSGKTTVLEAVISDRRDRALRCIRISDPDKVPAALATQIEQVAYAEAGKPENLERHVVLAVDDAHTASEELLRCLVRLASMREPGRRVPQIILTGRPELWNRLAADEYEPLARRLAIRSVLPAAEEDIDPWATLEQEVTRTMAHMRAEAELLPPSPTDRRVDGDYDGEYGSAYADGNDPVASEVHDEAAVPPPSMYALFPDPPPRATRSAARESRRRLLVPIAGLFVGVTAFALVLSFYDWPDLIGDMPWSDHRPATPFVMPNLPQTESLGLPIPPGQAAANEHPRMASAAPLMHQPPKIHTNPAPIVPAPVEPEPPRPAPAVEAARPAVEPPKPAPVEAEHAPAPPPAPVAVATATPHVDAQPTSPPAASPTSAAAPTPAPVEAQKPPVIEAQKPVVAAEPTAAAKPPVVSAPTTPVAIPVAPAPTTHRVVVASRLPSAIPPAIISLLLRRGDEQSAIGDLSAARSFYERAAEGGSAQGARQMARTFDTAFLPPADSGMADSEAARAWYGRAASLGDKEAAARLRALREGK